MFVVDSSVALAWFFEDESTARTIELLERSADDGIVVPQIWRYEMINGFRSAMLRSRMNHRQAGQAVVQLLRLAAEVDESSDERIRATYDLSNEYALPCYDAAYLELARHRQTPLATNDGQLADAARKLRVELL